jgi:hypothetical protein
MVRIFLLTLLLKNKLGKELIFLSRRGPFASMKSPIDHFNSELYWKE